MAAMADTDQVPRQRVRVLVLLLATLCAISVVVVRSRVPKPLAPTGLAVPADVEIRTRLELGGSPLECQEVRLTRDRVGVRVYSRDASLRGPPTENLEFTVDVRLRLDDGSVSGTVLGTPDHPFSLASGATLTGWFGWSPPLDEVKSWTAVVTSGGLPVQVREGRLKGCEVSFVPAGLSAG